MHVVNLLHIVSCEDGMTRYASEPMGQHPLPKEEEEDYYHGR
jgi:hypothetical protein